MKVILNKGDKYIQAEYRALAELLKGTGQQELFYEDVYRFACWVLTIDELFPADKMEYIRQITGIQTTKRRARHYISGGSRAVEGYEGKVPEIVRALADLDVARGQTFGENSGSTADRLLAFMELFAFGICTTGNRKYSQLEKDKIQSFLSAARVYVRSTYEKAEKTASEGTARDAENLAAGKEAGPESEDPEALITRLTGETAVQQKQGIDPELQKRSGRLLIISVICILVGAVFVYVIWLLISESKYNVMLMEGYTGTQYTKEQIAQMIAEQQQGQWESLLNIAFTLMTQILPGVLGVVAAVLVRRKAEDAENSGGRRPGWYALLTAEALSIIGIVRTIVMLFIGPNWMALVELPQLAFLWFARGVRKLIKN